MADVAARTQGGCEEAVHRSLMMLKALTYCPDRRLVAAPTTSLPEAIGGVRNWDYRFCWLRDASFTLAALVENGFVEEAGAWRDWLLRAVAGVPDDLQIMYGVGRRAAPDRARAPVARRLRGLQPVRIGNGASQQFQLDVYGEVLDALYQARSRGLARGRRRVGARRSAARMLEQRWREPDEGIWEVRGPRRHFTHSKVMAWVAFDRGSRG